MASKNVEIKVGLLVLASVAILIFAVYLARGFQYGQEFYSVSVMFPEVGALSSGDPVAVSGVTSGKVKSIALKEGAVEVRVDLMTEVKLKEDATFTVKNIGLMGERFVAIQTGRSEIPFDMTTPAWGEFDHGIPEVMGMMGGVISKMSDLVSLLKETAISPTTLDKFSETVARLHRITGQLEVSATTNLPRIDSAVSGFANMTQELKETVGRNLYHLDSGAVRFDEASQRFNGVLSDMAEASVRLKSFANDLDNSEGSLRLLLEDRRLYDDLRRTAHNIDSLVNDVRAHPKKYINFTVEIF